MRRQQQSSKRAICFQLEILNGLNALPTFLAYFCYSQQLENWFGNAYSLWEASKNLRQGGRNAKIKSNFILLSQLLEIRRVLLSLF